MLAVDFIFFFTGVNSADIAIVENRMVTDISSGSWVLWHSQSQPPGAKYLKKNP